MAQQQTAASAVSNMGQRRLSVIIGGGGSSLSPTRPLPEATRLARRRYRRLTGVVAFLLTITMGLSVVGVLHLWDLSGPPRAQRQTAAAWWCAYVAAA